MDTDRGPNERYQMFSREGNDMCEIEVAKIVAEAASGTLSRRTLRERVVRAHATICAAGHEEVYDTEPQYEIAHEINTRVCKPQMWLEFTRWGEEE